VTVDICTDEAAAFLRTVVTPRRRPTPRLAPSLDGVPRHRVATPHGDVAAWRLGAGPAVALVHGWEDDSSLWEPMIRELVTRGRAVVVLDLPAHGYSDGEWGLGWQAADALAAVAAALGPVDVVVGHSMGAAAAVGAIVEGFRVSSCALLAPPLVGGDRWLRLADRHGVSTAHALAAKAAYEAAIGSSRAAFDMAVDLATIDVDVLLVVSRDDERSPVDRAEHAASGARRCTTLVLDGVGHRDTARDPRTIGNVADFAGRSAPSLDAAST
jgi:pimeloyl-ACP methyl ester carboxylesterase